MKRYFDWIATLTESDQAYVKKKTSKAILLFKEHTHFAKGDSEKQSLYSALKLLICVNDLWLNKTEDAASYVKKVSDLLLIYAEKLTGRGEPQSTPYALYLEHGPLLAALASITVSPLKHNSLVSIELSKLRVLECEAMMNENLRIIHQNPFEGQKIWKLARISTMQKTKKSSTEKRLITKSEILANTFVFEFGAAGSL
jgi:hypothetical protein